MKMHAEPGPRTHTDPGREAIQAQPAHIPVQTQSPKPRLTYAIRLSERQSDEGFGAAAAAEHARHGHGVAHSRGDVEGEVRATACLSACGCLPSIAKQLSLSRRFLLFYRPRLSSLEQGSLCRAAVRRSLARAGKTQVATGALLTCRRRYFILARTVRPGPLIQSVIRTWVHIT